jgi:hypothetical protein
VRIPVSQMVVLIVLAALPIAARADVYRCTGSDGKTLYSDSPCPHDAVRKANITAAVGVCGTAECETRRQQAVEDARERLRLDKQELAVLTEKRRIAELETERERASLEALRLRQSMQSGFAAGADDTVYAGAYAPYYAGYPIYWWGRPCGGSRCLKPQLRAQHAKAPLVPRERGHAALRQATGMKNAR